MAEISLSNPASQHGAFCALPPPAIGRARATHDEVDCGRSRIEATIGLKGGQLIARHINIIAVTPGKTQQEIVRYVLNPEPTGDLASKIAQRISDYREEKLASTTLTNSAPDSEHDLVKDIYKLVTDANKELPEDRHYSFGAVIVPSTESLVEQVIRKTHADNIPHGQCLVPHSSDAQKNGPDATLALRWERLIPSFKEYVTDPTLLDCRYSVRGVRGDTEYSNLVTIEPKYRQALIKAGKYGPGHEESYEFKVVCRDGFLSSPHSEQELISELLIQSWNALEIVQFKGPKWAHEMYSTAEQDERLLKGIVDSSTAEQHYVLPSGAQVCLEVGTGVAALSIQASENPQTASFSWVITADGDYTKRAIDPEKDDRLRVLRAIMPRLAEGSVAEVLHRIGHLSELRIRKQVARGTSPDIVMGDDLWEQLEDLQRSEVRVVKPLGERNILDLLDGIQTVEFTFNDPKHNRHRPQDPERMRLGFGPNEELKLSLFNSVSNHIEAAVPAFIIEERGGRSAIVREVLDLFDQQTEESLTQLRSVIEEFAEAGGQFGIHPLRAHAKINQMPSVHNSQDCKAYDIAAEVAKIYQVATKAALAELSVYNFPTKGSVLKACSDFSKDILAELFVHIDADGIFQIDLQTRERDDQKPLGREVFILERPLLLPPESDKREEKKKIDQEFMAGTPVWDIPERKLLLEERITEQVLTELFIDFHTMLRDEAGIVSGSDMTLEDTRAFQLLRALEEKRA